MKNVFVKYQYLIKLTLLTKGKPVRTMLKIVDTSQTIEPLPFSDACLASMLWPEQPDVVVLPPVGLHTLEQALGVVENLGPGVDADGLQGQNLRQSPSTLLPIYNCMYSDYTPTIRRRFIATHHIPAKLSLLILYHLKIQNMSCSSPYPQGLRNKPHWSSLYRVGMLWV